MAVALRTYNLIAIAGLANSGKDCASSMLQYILNAPKIFRTYNFYKIFRKFPFKKRFKITAFAKPLKQALSVILNKPLSWFNVRENKENYYVVLDTLKIVHKNSLIWEKLSENKFQKLIKSGEPLPTDTFISIRQLMQYFGTECVRHYLGDKTWINATLNVHPNERIIVSDLRFKVEYQEVKNRNGLTIYIQRNSAKPGTHASEREVIDLYENNAFDYIIENNGTLKDLFNNLKKIV